MSWRPTRARGCSRPTSTSSALARLLVAVLDGLEFQFLLGCGALDIVTPLRHLLELFYVERSWAT